MNCVTTRCKKNGILYDQAVYVNTRTGTSLADISEAKAAQTFSVAYRNSNAGSVNLFSEGDAIIEKGANINISGGSIQYLGGIIPLTELESAGVVYTMANASPNLTYQKIFNTSYYQTGYVQGMNAGTVSIDSRDVVLDGVIQATTTAGLFQRAADTLPAGGMLNIDTTQWFNISQQDVLFQATQTYTAVPQSGGVQTPIYLSPALFSHGLNGLNLKTGGNLTLAKNAQIKVSAHGSISMQAGDMTILGDIIAPSGNVTLSTNANVNSSTTMSGDIHLAAGSVIDSSGAWINDLTDLAAGNSLKPLALNAGNISLSAQGNLWLDQGSSLVANGGAWLASNLKLSSGNGGNISLSTAGTSSNGNQGFTGMRLDASLSAYSVTQDGALSITANSIDIANSFSGPPVDSATLDLPASLLNSGGFSSYTLTANAGNLNIAANTAITLQQSNWHLTGNAYHAASGSNLDTLVNDWLLTGNLRVPVDLSLNLAQNASINGYVEDRSITLGANAVINTDPAATVSFNSDANIYLNGAVHTPGGNINLQIFNDSDFGYNPNQVIALGANALLDASGTTVMTPSTAGLALGEVLAGGTVTITANRGYILTDSSSLINVSGGNALLDIAYNGGYALQNVASAGGGIKLTAAEGMVLQGRLQGKAGSGETAAGAGSTAAAGALDITFNAQNTDQQQDFTFPTGSRNIIVSAQPVNLLTSSQIASGVVPTTLNGQAYISASQISQGGFGSLTLASQVYPGLTAALGEPETGAIIFDGDVSLTLNQSIDLDAPLISHQWYAGADSGRVTLTTDMFTLGSSLNQTPIGTLSNPATDLSSNGAAATLTVNANNIELRGGAMLDGFGKTSLLSSGDINMVGVINPNPGGSLTQELMGSLQLAGELDLSARDIYPATLSQYTITVDASLSPNGLIKILPAGEAAYTPLSAAGQLTLDAANIVSYGNLLAPFGSIALDATNTLTLAAGSLTSVSAGSGVTIPFGNTTGSGAYWEYPISTDVNEITNSPAKSIALSAPTIDLASGSTVNLNGGGNLQAWELVQAPGGSIDYLSSGYQQSYAVLPAYAASFAPYDYLEFPGSGLSLGETVYLSAPAAGLAAGEYVLLPSYYALLPGAYLITPQSAANNLGAGDSMTLTDGATVVAGYLGVAGSTVSSSLWSGFEVQQGSVALSYSPYQLSTASSFFAANTAAGSVASLPADAGNLSLQALNALNLDGQIYASAISGGLGGQLDISGNNFIIANQAGNSGNALFLDATSLNNLGVDSILIGGSRSRNASGTALTVTAQTIDVAAGVSLHAPEIILAATDNITVESGATIAATGSLSHSDSLLTISNANSGYDDGALLRVSDAAQASVVRGNLAGVSGTVDLQAGSTLQSTGSILIDASLTGSLLGNIDMSQGSLTLSGSLITLGGGSNAAAGFQLSDSTLNQLNVASLVLSSYSSIDIAGAINLQTGALTLDAAGLYGETAAGQTASISAKTITLQNSAHASSTASPTGQGLLKLTADTITLGGGNYALDGFSQINFNATTSLQNTGSGVLNAGGNLSIDTPLWTAAAGANTTVNLGAYDLSLLAASSAAAGTALGATLTVDAGLITDQGHIDLGSGVVNMNAAQGVILASGGSIDVSGRSETLGANQAYSAGGQISLSSSLGNIDIQSGASLNVSGSSLGGNAGVITLDALNSRDAGAGNVALNGNIAGQAYHGGSGGSFNLAAGSFSADGVSSFSALNTFVQNGGFNSDLNVHLLGGGNLLVAAGDKVRAANVTLTADKGLIEVAGLIDVDAAQAGEIRLSANGGVQIDASAGLDAVSSAAASQGGGIVLTSAPLVDQGDGVSIAAGAQLNVAGGSSGSGGTVEVVVNQLNNNDAPVSLAANTVHGDRSMVVDAMANYQNISLGNAQILAMYDANQQYLSAAPLNGDLQNRLGGFTLQPGLDIASTTSLSLNLSESLAGGGWQQAATLNTWYINLADVAGNVGSLTENGVALTEMNNSDLSTKGSYYFDNNPQSSTFRDLFVYLNPVGNNYNPNTLSQNGGFTLTETNGWDLALPYTPNQTASTGLLSLRAAGDLNIEQTLSDGFGIASDTQLILQSGPSWGYNLIAGADLQSANLEDIQFSSTAGNLTVGGNTSIRTGTGDIYAAAAGNIVLTDWTSTIYTAGQSSITDPYLSYRPLFAVAYPTGGGDVSLYAAGNIVGATTSQLMSDWLQRIGTWSAGNISTSNVPLAWGIDFGYLLPTTVPGSTSSVVNDSLGFRENIGALGGGDVSIHAGQSIQNLSVMLPTTAITTVTNGGAVRQEQGGGNLTVTAGGDIAGGVFYVEKGAANISAGGAITGGSEYTAGPVFGLGDSQFNVTAAGGIEIGTVMNPFVLPEAKFFYTSGNAYFTTYTANTSLNLQSLAGDVNLNNNTTVIAQNYDSYSYTGNKLKVSNQILNGTTVKAAQTLLSLYPGNLGVTALTAGININSTMYLSPAANTSFDLLAEDNVTLASGVLFYQLDVSPDLLLSVNQPMTSPSQATVYLYTALAAGAAISTLHAATPIHAADTSVNQIVSAQGSVVGIGSSTSSAETINAAKATNVSAAVNFSNLSLQIQNLNTLYQDVSTISAGQNIDFPTTRDSVTGAFQGNGSIVVAGPGRLNVWAGGSINLGVSAGITSIGSLDNPALPAAGADITVLAGDQIDNKAQSLGLDAYLQNYVSDNSYSSGLAAQLATQLQSGNTALIADLRGLIAAIDTARTQMPAAQSTSARLQLALPILFDQFDLAVVEANGDAGKAAYQIGYDAIKLLFPAPATGDISLDFSQIQTLAGGNINLLAPGGALDVGLAASDLVTGKSAAQLGVVAQGTGNINILTKGNIEVNQSRIFALEGGDLTIWSSYGNIDAGRGAKSSQGSQLPIGVYDASGNLVLEYPPTISGSGIRAQSAYGSVSGNVTLAAPGGVVNAGEAGIGGKNVNIAAAAVIGAGNIQASGSTLGVPSTQTAIAAPNTLAVASASITKSADLDMQADENGQEQKKQTKSGKVILLSSQLLGFGNCSVSDIRDNRNGCGK
ncbi:MAG: filamentous hemagglutinin family protein [Methylococcales bacterium]|nr:filamentous hemagglutinin family protein [Methylococcales bacterium]